MRKDNLDLDEVMEVLRTLLIEQIPANADRLYKDEDTAEDEWKAPVYVRIVDYRLTVEAVFKSDLPEEDIVESRLEEGFPANADKAVRFYIDTLDTLPPARYTRLSSGAGLTYNDFIDELGVDRYRDIRDGGRDLDDAEYAKMVRRLDAK